MMLDVLSWGSKVGIIDTGRVLDRDGNTVVASSAVAEVVVLEVEGYKSKLLIHPNKIMNSNVLGPTSLSETVFEGDVVDSVDDIECIGASGIKVSLDRGGLTRILGEDEVQARR